MDIDAVGTFNFRRAAFPHLRAAADRAGGGAVTADSPQGVIINISATLHYGATWYQAHACAAKAAVDALTRALALEWGAAGVRVVGVAPGPIAGTAGMTKLAPGDGKVRVACSQSVHEGLELTSPLRLFQLASLAAEVPLQRLGVARDIGWACVFLASRAASFVTGETLVVDGGAWLARPQLVPRAAVAQASRGVERASRAVGVPSKAKL